MSLPPPLPKDPWPYKDMSKTGAPKPTSPVIPPIIQDKRWVEIRPQIHMFKG